MKMLNDEEIWEIVSVWDCSTKAGSLGVYDNRKDAEAHFDRLKPKPYVRYFLCKIHREVVAFHHKEVKAEGESE